MKIKNIFAIKTKKKLLVYLIKPSKYDDDGYVLRHWKGILPSNTLACLSGLTEDVRKREVLGKDLKWKIILIDESVQKVEVNKIIKESKKNDNKVIVCLVGVQSNQFPRASDLALEFRKGKVDVLIGGFHVSGSVSMIPVLPPEIKTLIDAGVTIIAGEAEGKWESILNDALQNNLKPIYNFLCTPPDIRFAPMPHVNKEYLNRFISSNYTTLDCGRGCPFDCSFCTVVNVHGRMMRCRDVNKIMDLLRENYYKHKILFYFFTDDNFSRNKNWEAIFNGLIQLREQEKIPIEFMIQVDTQSDKIPHFIEKARQAGCKHVFIGMESLNPNNLQSAGKKHNHVEEFKNLISAYRKHEIDTHIAYIIGFPFDTTESIREDVERLKNELGPEQASFFIMTPLPGSKDHNQFKKDEVPIDPDLNKYDSFHVTLKHPNMTSDEIMAAYNNAWTSFYSLENMVEILKRVPKKNYWEVFMKCLFYKNSVFIENGHPMLEGIFRFKDRLQRRPGCQIEPPLKHFIRRLKDIYRNINLWIKLALEMEEVWLRTRPRSNLEECVIKELQKRYAYTKQWRELKIEELKSAYCSAILSLLKTNPISSEWKKLTTSLNLWFKKQNIFSQSLTYSRKSFEEFWKETRKQITNGNVLYINITKLISTTIQESMLFVHFSYSFLIWLIPHLFRGHFVLRKEKALATSLTN
ncbi:MAG: radical SAM protein [Candidatus Melainabacteria bacterium]|nr:radical SAM protein [Candidatus Melainabacteria bacterium]